MEAGNSQIGKHLRQKHRVEPFHALDFDDDFIANDQIGPVLRDQFTFVKYRNADLAAEGQTNGPKFDTQRRFVNRFEEARSEVSMYLDGTSNDLFGQVSGE
jgi:hypothetical protein